MTDPGSTSDAAPADSRVGQAYVLFAVSMFLVVSIGSVVQIASVRVGLAITELVLILLPAVIFVRQKRLSVFEALRWRPISPEVAFLSFAVGITSWGVAAGVFVLVQPLLGEPPAIEALEPKTVRDLLLVLFYAALLPGLCEESLFRGAIQGVLTRKGQRRSVVITALLFAFFHVNPWVFLSAFFLGVVFGMLVVRTGSSVSAMLAHIANNATAFTVTYVYHDQPESAPYVLMIVLTLGCCLTYPVFWARTQRIDAAPPILEAVPAGVERGTALAIRLVAGSAAILVVAAVAGALLLVEFRTVTDESLGPGYESGDQLVIFKSGMVQLDLEAGDIVSYPADGETGLWTVVRMEKDTAWISTGGSELPVLRKEIIGKVVHVIERR